MSRRLLASPGYFYFALIVGFLYLPIALLVIFSFNDSALMVFPLKGFTLKWYGALLETEELLKSLGSSLLVGLASSAVATVVGTTAAIGIMRFRFPGRGLFVLVASMPLVVPYVVLGVALLIFFGTLNIPLSLGTVGVGHVIISIPYVLLIVASRLAGFPSTLEEAAMDRGQPIGRRWYASPCPSARRPSPPVFSPRSLPLLTSLR